ncbi:FAD-dependent oxidoreductase [Methanocella sp. MCL-LM]|uniref:FAD-dependent oxidoreductase n=1 Tax=Methanocella sp. MCL-LM TaxID=3412035 RepID=UPI003C7195E7
MATESEGKHGVQGKSESFWTASTPDPGYPALSGDLKVDVAVLGGGITGITSALKLKKAGLKVALVEGRRILHGATGYTTAHVSSAQALQFGELIGLFGEQKARMIADSQQASVEEIARTAREYGIDCDLARPAEYVYAADEGDLKDLNAEFEANKRLGLPVSYVDKAPLPFENYGAIRYDNQLRFHPRKYLLPLAQAINGDGSYVFENTMATDIDDGETCKVKTYQGTITANHVIVATQVPFTMKDLLVTRMKAYRSYVLGVRVEGDVSPDMFYSTEEPCHYIRTTPADGGNLVIIGGEDHQTGKVTDTIQKYRTLEQYARERYRITSIDYSWSTEDYYTFDGVPFIGRMPNMKHCYIGTGYKGTGMTYGTVAAMINADLILNGSSPWEEAYNPHRVKLTKEAGEMLAAQGFIMKHFVGERLKGPEPLAKIPAGGAGFSEYKGHKANVYKEASGDVHAVTPQCTHMGCYTEWNNGERTWECPCHGSWFGYDGSVLHGPTVKPLKRLDEKEQKGGQTLETKH